MTSEMDHVKATSFLNKRSFRGCGSQKCFSASPMIVGGERFDLALEILLACRRICCTSGSDTQEVDGPLQSSRQPCVLEQGCARRVSHRLFVNQAASVVHRQGVKGEIEKVAVRNNVNDIYVREMLTDSAYQRFPDRPNVFKVRRPIRMRRIDVLWREVPDQASGAFCQRLQSEIITRHNRLIVIGTEYQDHRFALQDIVLHKAKSRRSRNQRSSAHGVNSYGNF